MGSLNSEASNARLLERESRPTPSIDIVMLGDVGVGKHTFISQLQHVRNGALNPVPYSASQQHPSPASMQVHFSRGLPQTFSVSLFARPYDVTIHTSTSPLFIDPFPTLPSFFILAYSVTSRVSLLNVQKYWRNQISIHYPGHDNHVPVMLLGLKRDARTDARDDEGHYICVMPQEALRVAQEMLCDRYAECSALTGELMWEALEDITRTAAKTTTAKGGKSEGAGCSVM